MKDSVFSPTCFIDLKELNLTEAIITHELVGGKHKYYIVLIKIHDNIEEHVYLPISGFNVHYIHEHF